MANYIKVIITGRTEGQVELFPSVLQILSKHHCMQEACSTPGRGRAGSSSSEGRDRGGGTQVIQAGGRRTQGPHASLLLPREPGLVSKEVKRCILNK